MLRCPFKKTDKYIIIDWEENDFLREGWYWWISTPGLRRPRIEVKGVLYEEQKLEARNQVFRIDMWWRKRVCVTSEVRCGPTLRVGRCLFKIRKKYKMIGIAEQRHKPLWGSELPGIGCILVDTAWFFVRCVVNRSPSQSRRLNRLLVNYPSVLLFSHTICPGVPSKWWSIPRAKCRQPAINLSVQLN